MTVADNYVFRSNDNSYVFEHFLTVMIVSAF